MNIMNIKDHTHNLTIITAALIAKGEPCGSIDDQLQLTVMAENIYFEVMESAKFTFEYDTEYRKNKDLNENVGPTTQLLDKQKDRVREAKAKES